jgi:hypothetical protein
MELSFASAPITINVKSTGGWCRVHQTNPSELTRSIAVTDADFLPVDRNVALLHNDRILSPYLSFLYQRVQVD